MMQKHYSKKKFARKCSSSSMEQPINLWSRAVTDQYNTATWDGKLQG